MVSQEGLALCIAIYEGEQFKTYLDETPLESDEKFAKDVWSLWIMLFRLCAALHAKSSSAPEYLSPDHYEALALSYRDLYRLTINTNVPFYTHVMTHHVKGEACDHVFVHPKYPLTAIAPFSDLMLRWGPDILSRLSCQGLEAFNQKQNGLYHRSTNRKPGHIRQVSKTCRCSYDYTVELLMTASLNLLRPL
jgi:hypothetical protein